jgi:hypothetical protein
MIMVKKLQTMLADFAQLKPVKDSQATNAVAVDMVFSMANSSVAMLKVDDKFVPRDAEGKATVKLKPGNHRMTWRGFGAPNTEYVIGITAPEHLKFEPDPPFRTDSQGFGGNDFDFTV